MKIPNLSSLTEDHYSHEAYNNENYFRFHSEALSCLSKRDQWMFQYFGQGNREKPPFSCLHTAFEEQARIRPTQVAATHEGQSISYGELNDKAVQLALYLRSEGVVEGDAVGLFLSRSIPMLIAILAVLKLGASYVPQHAGVAPKRVLKHVCDIAAIRIVLTLSKHSQDLPHFERQKVIYLDRALNKPKDDVSYDFPDVKPSSRCFILFTSGTTGSPNGVQVTHNNVTNIVLTSPGNLQVQAGMRVGQILSISFDMCAWEIFVALCHGAELVIRSSSIEQAVSSVDIVIATPSILASLDLDKCKSVRVAAVAGEPCPQQLADSWAEFCVFYNSCGPTETTIINTAQQYSGSGEKLTIGKPTPNNTVYILDDSLKPCPIGEVGEMWAGGECVTDGYIGNELLNAERYKPDPFLGNGYRMFRTRDLGKWTENGELLHLGRTDDQVKIRGFRVELDSISRIIERTENCYQAVTLKIDEKTLVSFVIPSDVNTEDARELVAKCLPYYCVPETIIKLDKFPKTERGKIDKSALLKHLKAVELG